MEERRGISLQEVVDMVSLTHDTNVMVGGFWITHLTDSKIIKHLLYVGYRDPGMPDPVCVRQMNTYLSLWQVDIDLKAFSRLSSI